MVMAENKVEEVYNDVNVDTDDQEEGGVEGN